LLVSLCFFYMLTVNSWNEFLFVIASSEFLWTSVENLRWPGKDRERAVCQWIKGQQRQRPGIFQQAVRFWSRWTIPLSAGFLPKTGRKRGNRLHSSGSLAAAQILRWCSLYLSLRIIAVVRFHINNAVPKVCDYRFQWRQEIKKEADWGWDKWQSTAEAHRR
jgi:hypothetical protein